MGVMNFTPVRPFSTESILNICVGILLLLLISGPSYSTCFATSMQAGDILATGDSLVLGGCALTMQTDCNLVLFISGISSWLSNTSGKGDGHCQLRLNDNGQLVIFDAGNIVWTTPFQGANGNYALLFNGDCNIYIKDLNDGHIVWTNKA